MLQIAVANYSHGLASLTVSVVHLASLRSSFQRQKVALCLESDLQVKDLLTVLDLESLDRPELPLVAATLLDFE